jgi:hypothetical protein
MYVSRKTLLSVTLIGALFGAPALTPVTAHGALGGLGHPPVVQPATLEPRSPSRRRLRRAKVRLIVWPPYRWLDEAATTMRARFKTVRPRPAPRDSYPRGPPPSSAG